MMGGFPALVLILALAVVAVLLLVLLIAAAWATIATIGDLRRRRKLREHDWSAKPPVADGDVF